MAWAQVDRRTVGSGDGSNKPIGWIAEVDPANQSVALTMMGAGSNKRSGGEDPTGEDDGVGSGRLA